jgi:hypothetical protein
LAPGFSSTYNASVVGMYIGQRVFFKKEETSFVFETHHL